LAPTAKPEITQPSISWCGSFSIRTRSLKVPGSDSSALQTMYFGFGELRGTKLHFMRTGSRRRATARPDFLTSSMISSAPS